MTSDKKAEKDFRGLSLKEFEKEIERLRELAKSDKLLKSLGRGAEEISRKSEGEE